MSEIKLIVSPFEMGTEKEAAKKLPEEAAEVYAAWDEVDDCGSPELCRNCDLPNPCKSILALADEIADVIQASCNLAARYNLDLQAAMLRCEQKNRSRGRYPMEDEDAKPCGIHDSHDCNCGGSCGAVPVGMDVLRPKSPEEMSVEELIEALYIANGGSYYRNNSCSCTKNFDHDWCYDHGTCTSCRERLLDLLKAAHEREMENAHKREEMQVDALEAITREVAEKQRQIDDLVHERDGLRNRLAELSEAGITGLHRLLRETLGEAKNVTHNARVYINKKHGSNNERCGDCGTDSGRDSCDCGVERAGEHVLSAESTAQEISEREKVLERLRGYDVYMTEPPSKNANRLFACITGNKDAEIACGNDIEAVRDKLIELIGEGGAE